jgi:hypothetical protein
MQVVLLVLVYFNQKTNLFRRIGHKKVSQHHQIAGKSLEINLPSKIRNGSYGLEKEPGYGNNGWYWITRSQVPNWNAVHRLNVGGVMERNPLF